MTREGARRVQTYAFELAEKRRKKLTSVDKANVLSDVYGLWRDVFSETAKNYPGVYDRVQLRGCRYDVVCEKPRVVRCCRHSQYVR
jgi:isocitrate/isopropylmalate dehydrogenase